MSTAQPQGPLENPPERAPDAPAPAPALSPLLYAELRHIARLYFRKERAGHTLRPTALVHEAYLQLARAKDVPWDNPAKLRAFAARAMEAVLAHHARRRGSLKRGGGRGRVPLEDVIVVIEKRPYDILALHEALDRLSAQDPEKASVVELRFLRGLTIEQTVETLGISHSRVERDWKFARAWLHRELSGSEQDGGRHDG